MNNYSLMDIHKGMIIHQVIQIAEEERLPRLLLSTVASILSLH